jgi:hypothetical protein
MYDVIQIKTKNPAAAPIAKAIVIESLEELRVAMTETIGYAALVGCDVDQVRECIKEMADMIDLEE